MNEDFRVHIASPHEGYCMRCNDPQAFVVAFNLGNFAARLCIAHARELREELGKMLYPGKPR